MKKETISYEAYRKTLNPEQALVTDYLETLLSTYYKPEECATWTGTFWSGSDQVIRGFGLWNYTNRSKENVEWFHIGYAVQTQYISLYINAVKDGQYLVKSYKDRLGKVKIGASSLSFKSLDALNLSVFEALIGEAASIMKENTP